MQQQLSTLRWNFLQLFGLNLANEWQPPPPVQMDEKMIINFNQDRINRRDGGNGGDGGDGGDPLFREDPDDDDNDRDKNRAKRKFDFLELIS